MFRLKLRRRPLRPLKDSEGPVSEPVSCRRGHDQSVGIRERDKVPKRRMDRSPQRTHGVPQGVHERSGTPPQMLKVSFRAHRDSGAPQPQGHPDPLNEGVVLYFRRRPDHRFLFRSYQ